MNRSPADAEIFISYRRGDSASSVRALATELTRTFGSQSVFLDLDSIEPGRAFAAEIERQLAGASVALIVIGSGWLDVEDDHGRRRLLDPNDLVRLEVESALRHLRRTPNNMLVVPVLVDDAVMPDPNRLPSSLLPLSTLQATPLRNADWNNDIGRLVAVVRSRLPSAREAPDLGSINKQQEIDGIGSGEAAKEPLVGELVDLEFIDSFDIGAAAKLRRWLEPFLGTVQGLIDSGAFDHDEQLEIKVERDRSYLHNELFEVDPTEGLDAAIVVSVAQRLIRNVIPVIEPGPGHELLDTITSSSQDNLKDPAGTVEAVQQVADSIDPSKLPPETESTGVWLVEELGWGVGVGGSVVTVLTALAVSGPIAVVFGAVLGIMTTVWKNLRKP